MRTRSDSQNSSGSPSSSSSNRFRRQIDEEEEAEELDFSQQFERDRAFPSSMSMNSNGINNPGLPPQPSHLSRPFVPLPPPPPPPQQFAAHNPLNQQRQQVQAEHQAATSARAFDTVNVFDNEHSKTTPWVLKLYCPTSTTPFIDQRNEKQHDNDEDVDEQSAAVIRVHVTPDMSPESWKQCIQHATLQYSVAPIAGLFRKGDFGYFSLEYIWATSSSKTQNEYWLYLPPNYRDHRRRRQRDFPRPIWQRMGWIGGIGVLLVISATSILLRRMFAKTSVVKHAPSTGNTATILGALLLLPTTLQQSLYDYSTWIHQVFIHQPIQDFYRHGPTWLGAWEGMPLSQICVRLSLMGDEDFWRRNMEDCQRMYQLKQEAVVRTIQPLVYFGILYVMWSAMKVEYLRRRQYRPDPNMVELYHAFHVVLRQVQRVLVAPQAGQGRR